MKQNPRGPAVNPLTLPGGALAGFRGAAGVGNSSLPQLQGTRMGVPLTVHPSGVYCVLSGFFEDYFTHKYPLFVGPIII